MILNKFSLYLTIFQRGTNILTKSILFSNFENLFNNNLNVAMKKPIRMMKNPSPDSLWEGNAICKINPVIERIRDNP